MLGNIYKYMLLEFASILAILALIDIILVMPKIKATSNKVSIKEEKPRKLLRSETDRMIAGVAGGIGEYFMVDPIIIRIIFIVLACQGAGVILYLILWLIIPSEKNSDPKEEMQTKAKELTKKSHFWLGLTVLVLGFYLLLQNFGFYHFFRLERFWPLLLILLGVAILNKKNAGQN